MTEIHEFYMMEDEFSSSKISIFKSFLRLKHGH